jgi:hypothetical protein
MDILKACGMVEQHLSGGNWVAVRFLSRYAAEKALSSQPIYSTKSNLYYGISRLTPERLRILQQQKSKVGVADNQPTAGQLLAITDGASKPLEESDVLMRDARSVIERPSKPENVCQQVLAWWFGWNYETDTTPAAAATAVSKHSKLD